MLIEKEIELKIVQKLEEVLGDGFQVMSSWSENKEKLNGKNGIASVFVSPRGHDAFSRPTVNVNGAVVLETRIEANGLYELSDAYDKVSTMFDHLHFDSHRFSQEFSTNDFYATELRLDNGDRIQRDSTTGTLQIGIAFAIRGSVNHVGEF